MRQWIFLIIVFFACPALYAQAKQIFVTANGLPVGNCLGGLHTPAWFNDPTNWGPGSGQIGAGTTVLICGAFVDSTPGDGLLTVQGNGTSESPITLLFDTNASLTNTAYWGTAVLSAGAIYIGSHSWIVVDGGANGLIQNTGNGTGLAYEHNSSGIGENGGDHITIKNLTIANICQHTSTSDTVGCVTSGNIDSAITLINGTNLTVQNNVIHDTQEATSLNASAGNVNFLFTGNRIYRCNWGVGVGIAVAGTASGIVISNNDISDPANWDSTTDTFHHNGIMVFDSAGGGFSGVVESGNYIHGDFGLNSTAFIFNADNTASMTGFYIYNNRLVNDSVAHKPNDGFIYGVPQASFAFNNTILGSGVNVIGIFLGIGNGANVTIENNLISTASQFIAAISPIRQIDYNSYMATVTSGCASFLYGGGPCSGQANFAAWKAACSCDAHGAYNASNSVNSDGTLQANSPARGAGVNLTSLGIAGLNIGANGVARPATGAWDVGAYQTSPPPPPTNLRGVVR